MTLNINNVSKLRDSNLPIFSAFPTCTIGTFNAGKHVGTYNNELTHPSIHPCRRSAVCTPHCKQAALKCWLVQKGERYTHTDRGLSATRLLTIFSCPCLKICGCFSPSAPHTCCSPIRPYVAPIEQQYYLPVCYSSAIPFNGSPF